MSNHTKGPWVVEHDLGDGTPIVTFEARNIATVETYFGDGEANANLIAAAPELLDTAKSVLASLEAMTPDATIDGCIMVLESTIAKAEGREE